MKEPNYDIVFNQLKKYNQSQLDYDHEIYLRLTDESVFISFPKNDLKNKFIRKKAEGFFGNITIKEISPYKDPFELDGKLFSFIEMISDHQIGSAIEVTKNDKSHIFMVSRDEGETWKFLPENYYLGYGQTENGVGFINKHPEVLPQEVWDHFYRALDPESYK